MQSLLHASLIAPSLGISSVDIHNYRGFVKPGCRVSEDGGTRHHQSVSPHAYLARHRGGSRSARRVICWKRAILWPPDHVLPDVPSSLALIFRSKISIDFRTYFFRDKYSAPRIPHLLASLASSCPSPPPDSCLLKALNYVAPSPACPGRLPDSTRCSQIHSYSSSLTILIKHVTPIPS